MEYTALSEDTRLMQSARLMSPISALYVRRLTIVHSGVFKWGIGRCHPKDFWRLNAFSKGT